MSRRAGPLELALAAKTIAECRGMLKAVREACDQCALLDVSFELNKAIGTLLVAGERVHGHQRTLPTEGLTRPALVRPRPSRPAPENVFINEATQRATRKGESA